MKNVNVITLFICLSFSGQWSFYNRKTALSLQKKKTKDEIELQHIHFGP